MGAKKILLASFYGNIPEYVYPEYAVLSSLRDTEHDLHVLQTGPQSQLFPGLEPLYIDPLLSPNTVHHKHMVAFESSLRKAYPYFNYHFFQDYISDVELAEIEEFVAGIKLSPDLSNYTEINFRGVNLGKLCIFCCLRRQRIEALEHINLQTHNTFRLSLRVGSMCITAAQNLSKKLKLDVVFLSEDLYTCSRTFLNTIRNMGKVEVLPLASGPIAGKRIEHTRIAEGFDAGWRERNIANWNLIKDKPQIDYSLIKIHFRNLFRGTTLFWGESPSVKQQFCLYKKWNIDYSKKIVVAAVSSLDEVFAMEIAWGKWNFKCIFKDQIKWLEALVDYFTERHDSHLIIRLHPRCFIDSENRETLILRRMKEMEKTFPSNISLNIPSDKISNYELMKHCHLVLSFISTTALEYGLFGIRSLNCVINYEYAPFEILGKIPKDESEYFRLLDCHINEPYQLDEDRIRKSFRWFRYHMETQTIDLSSIIRNKKHVWPERLVKLQRSVQTKLHNLGLCSPYNPMWHRPEAKSKDWIVVKTMIETGEDVTTIKIRDLDSHTLEQEWEEILKVLDDLIRRLYGIPSDVKIKAIYVNSDDNNNTQLSIEIYGSFGRKKILRISEYELLLSNIVKVLYSAKGVSSEKLVYVD